jgi:hypothetical protein
LRAVRRTHSIIDSHGFVDCSVFLSVPRTPSRVTLSVSSRFSRSDAAARTVKLAGQDPEALERDTVVIERPGLPESPLDRGAIALGQVIEHVALLSGRREAPGSALRGRLVPGFLPPPREPCVKFSLTRLNEHRSPSGMRG